MNKQQGSMYLLCGEQNLRHHKGIETCMPANKITLQEHGTMPVFPSGLWRRYGGGGEEGWSVVLFLNGFWSGTESKFTQLHDLNQILKSLKGKT
jgi:hypothetical protein